MPALGDGGKDWHHSLSHAVSLLLKRAFARPTSQSEPRERSATDYSIRFAAVRSAKAPNRASIPNIAIIGSGLAVPGSVFAGSLFAVAVITGGGVTATASCTSSPVGRIAIIGARLSSTINGASADLIGS